MGSTDDDMVVDEGCGINLPEQTFSLIGQFWAIEFQIHEGAAAVGDLILAAGAAF